MIIDLAEEIKKLIYKQKEDCYWDFKQSYNKNPVGLVHDIICLANCPFYSGERYLIFGVDDKCNIVGLSEDHNLVQSDIIVYRQL